MSGKSFVDTNILIYAYDVDQGEKHRIARDLLTELMTSRRGVLSPQVLQEFYVNATRKMAQPLTKDAARRIVEIFGVWSIAVTAAEVAAAFRIEDEAKISFWDALICASAIKAGAERVLSEDLNPGQRIGGILVENPFAGG
jgi:predicted nucleic acid-binding protein